VYQARKVKSLKISKRFRIALTCTKISSSSSLSWLGTRQSNSKPLWYLQALHFPGLVHVRAILNPFDIFKLFTFLAWYTSKSLKISKGFRITLTCTKPGKWRAWRYQRGLELLWRVPIQESEELEDIKGLVHVRAILNLFDIFKLFTFLAWYTSEQF
jgi:hypothetical protein